MLDRERDNAYTRKYSDAQTVTFSRPDENPELRLTYVTDCNGAIVGHTTNDEGDLYSVTVDQSRLPFHVAFIKGNQSEPVVMRISAEDLEAIRRVM